MGVVRVGVRGELIEDYQVLVPAGTWRTDLAETGVLLPGLVDLQVNGLAGIDLNSPDLSVDNVYELVRSLWSCGVTAFCPTIITAPTERIRSTLAMLSEVRNSDDRESQSLLGAHLEGPWISPADGARGAHPVDHIRTVSATDATEILNAGQVDILTIAPEVDGVIELIAAATARGIIVSIGHSAARPEHVRAAVNAGASMSTHLGNGVPLMIERHPNLIWEQLAEDRLTAMFIADFHHLDPRSLSAMIRAKGEDRVVLVSDATSLAGMPAGRYQTWIGGEVELDGQGRLSVAGTPYLAGAARTLLDGLSHILRSGLMAPQNAVASVSTVPHALVHHRQPGTGANVLNPGSRADLVIASWNPADSVLEAQRTVLAGETVWSA